jgi:hypothetical protein
MSKLKIGDILELKTLKGFCYLQYINKDSEIGEFISVLEGNFEVQLKNSEQAKGLKVRYIIAFPLTYAIKKKLIRNTYLNIELKSLIPKYMREENIIQGVNNGWHIVNTATWQRTSTLHLTEEEKKFSPWGVWNYNLLCERIEQDWGLENWI